MRVPATCLAAAALLAACGPAPTPTPPRAFVPPPTATTIVRVVGGAELPTPTAQPPPPTTTPLPPAAPAAPRPAGGPPPGAVPPGDGTAIVGIDVAPGTYRADPPVRPSGIRSCFWWRLSGTGGETSEIIAFDNASGPVVVTIAPTDRAFKSDSCGTWTRVG